MAEPVISTQVPPGPGVRPPFVAAPIEGRKARMWLGLGVAGGLLAACCVVGGVATGGLLVLGEQMANERAQRAVSDYLAAVVDQDWERAYALRCEQDQQAETRDEFAGRMSSDPQIESYEVGELNLEQGGGGLFDSDATVPVDVVYAGSAGPERITLPVEQDSGTGDFEVCQTLAQG
jgi:hypothetical protein